MSKNIRRFAAAASLAFVLAASTPVVAAPRDRDPRPDPVTRIVRIIKRFIGISPTAEIMPPIPVKQ
jgi:hypothetical protein